MDPITPAPTPTQTPPAPAPVFDSPDNPLGLPPDLPPLPPQNIVDPNAFAAPEQRQQPSAPAPVAPVAPVPATPTTPQTPTAPVDPLTVLADGLASIVGNRPATAAPGAPPNPNAPRDFTGLDPAEVDFFKQMSNGAYAHVYPKYIAAKQQQAQFEAEKAALAAQIEEAKKSRLYEHADAWKFDPEVVEASNNIAQLDTLHEYYLEQLAEVKQGKPWNDVVTNEKGQLVRGPAQQPSVAIEVAITNKLQEIAARKQHLGAQVFQRQQSFQSEFKQTYENLNAMRQKILGPYEAKLAPLRQPLLERFPKMLRDKPETLMIVDLVNVLSTVLAQRQTPVTNAGALASAAPAEAGAFTGQPTGTPSIAEIEARLAQMEAVRRGEYVVPQPIV